MLAIRAIEAKTDAERWAQQKSEKPNACDCCHKPWPESRRGLYTGFGWQFVRARDALSPGGFKFDKEFWTRDAEGHFQPETLDFIRKVINRMPNESEEVDFSIPSFRRR